MIANFTIGEKMEMTPLLILKLKEKKIIWQRQMNDGMCGGKEKQK